MAFQFDANPHAFNFFGLKEGQGWEGRTPDGKRIYVWVKDGDYVIQFPDAWVVQPEMRDHPDAKRKLQFTISSNGAYVLMCLLAMHMGICTDELQSTMRVVDDQGMLSPTRGINSV